MPGEGMEPEQPGRRRKLLMPKVNERERIQALEATQGRAVREATLGDASAMKRLKEIDAEITDLRRELARI